MSKVDTWMPLYIGDYLADTMHLEAREHGAYMLLIMHYWRNGPLPDDDRVLAGIARVSRQAWAAQTGALVRAFFQSAHGKLYHKRIEAERSEAVKISNVKRAAAQSRWAGKGNGSHPPAGADRTPYPGYGSIKNGGPQDRPYAATIFEEPSENNDIPRHERPMPDAHASANASDVHVRCISPSQVPKKVQPVVPTYETHTRAHTREDEPPPPPASPPAVAKIVTNPVPAVERPNDSRLKRSDPVPRFHSLPGLTWLKHDKTGADHPYAGAYDFIIALDETCIAANVGNDHHRWDWETLVAWLNDGIDLWDTIIPVIARRAAVPGYYVPRALTFFDDAIRAAPVYHPAVRRVA